MTRSAPPPSPAPAPRSTTRGRGCAPWLVGCGVVALIGLIVVGALAWWFAARPIAQIAQAAQSVSRISQIDARVANRAAFVAPADGELSEEQVDRYVSVLRRVRDDLEGRFRTLEARYAEIDGRRPEWTDIPRLAGAYSDFLGLLVEAKESQVAALNAEGFSLAEYAWVRATALGAAGLPGATYDLGAFVTSVTGDGRLDDRATTVVIPANRALIERRGAEFGDLAFLAVLGL
jgi:hypothetical protein